MPKLAGPTPGTTSEPRPQVRATFAGWRVLAVVLGLVVFWGLRGWGSDRVSVWLARPMEGGAGPSWVAADRVLVRIRPEFVGRAGALQGAWGAGVRWVVPRSAGRGLAAAETGGVAEQLAVVRLPAGADLDREMEALARRPEVHYVEPVQRLWLAAGDGGGGVGGQPRVPNDFAFPRQWGLHNTGQTGGKAGADIRALEAWSVTTGSRDVVVAVVDTGVDPFHPDLEPNLWTNGGEVPGNGFDDDGNGYVDDVHGYDFVSGDGDAMDDGTHGTHVAGILGAVGNDENGMAGVAWGVRLMALKAFDETGSGTLDDTLAAIAYARSAGARVINASWGTTTRSRALDELVAEVVKSGVVFVAAAGNNGSDGRFFPAAVPEALAVGATDATDASPAFSNHGSFVDLVAPGAAIESTMPNAAWTVLSGTSMAAPHVSGVAALLLSVRREFTPAEIATILRSTADELRTDRFTGAGRLNAGRAVAVREPLPEARLEVSGTLSGFVDVRGSVGGNRFAGFRLELGSGSRPEAWSLLAAGSAEVRNGMLLAGYDTASVDDGEYTLRLMASNHLGQTAVERVGITIANVRLSTPMNNDVMRHGEVVEVRGTVFGEGRGYEVAWGLGRTPARWETEGVELSAGGAVPVVDGILARWDTSRVPKGEFVTLRLQARAGERVVGVSEARMVHLEPRLRPGWPRRFPFEDEFPVANWREYNVADLDGDGRQEIVLVDHGEPGGRPPRLLALAPDGEVVWERALTAGAPEYDAPVIGDMNGDGRSEVFVDTGAGGAIAGYDASGRPLGEGWPVTPGGGHWGKILADLDGDGRLEMVALSRPPVDLEGARFHPLVVIDAGGRVLRRWLVAACDEEAVHLEVLPAVGNLDDDPALEIVAIDGCGSVSLFDLGRESGPVWSTATEANLFASPMVADLEGDGTEEVIVPCSSRGRGLPGGVLVLEPSGRPRRGWPAAPGESFRGGGALADLDGDGRLEIVIAGWESDVVHAIGADGFELRGWPTPVQVNGYPRSVPVVGDIDGDGLPDVVVASPGIWLQVVLGGDTARAGGVRAWRADGVPIDLLEGHAADGLVMEAPAGATWSRMPPVVLTDLDGNGRLDVVAGSVQDRAYSPTPPVTRAKMRSSLYAWELPVPAPKPGEMWLGYQGGPARSGRRARAVPPNEPPRIVGLAGQTIAPGSEFRPIRLDLYAEDPDGREDRLEWTGVAGAGLQLELGTDRVARVRIADAAWVGVAPVELRVLDPRGGMASVVLNFEVRPGYRPPVAVTDAGVIDEDGGILVLDVSGNDQSPAGRALRVGSVSRPGAGRTRLLEDGRVAYMPATNRFGIDRFEYTLLDDDGGVTMGDVRVEVRAVPDPPEAAPDRILLDEDGFAEFSLLENDTDPDGDELALVSVGQPARGVLEAMGGGRFRFAPRPDDHGLQELSYVVRDGSGLTSTGEVSLLVRPMNDLPVPRSQTVRLRRNRTADVIYDTVDPDGDRLTYRIVDGPAHGVLLAYPELANYAPQPGFFGRDRFTYTASDGEAVVGPVEVTLEIEEGNNPPDVTPSTAVTAVAQKVTIRLGARDVDDDPISLRIVEFPEHGTVTLDGTNAVYVPAPDFVGSDRFRFAASDGVDESVPAEVSLRVTDVNTAPVAQSEVLTVARNAVSPVTLRAVDGENNPLRYVVLSPTAFGTLSGEPPDLVYTPRAQFRGIDRLQFRAEDWELGSDAATVHLIVRDPNVAPVATNQWVAAVRGEAVTFGLEVVDPDGGVPRTVILKGPRGGRVYGSGLRYTYVPGPGFTGRDRFTYRVWDGFGYSAEATVTLDVALPEERVPEIIAVEAAGHGIRLRVRSTPGRALRVEVSSDLVRWEPRPPVENVLGEVEWADLEPSAEGDPARFYRVRMAGVGGDFL